MKTQNTFTGKILSRGIRLSLLLLSFSFCCSMSVSAKKVIYAEYTELDLESTIGAFGERTALVLKYGELPANDNVFDVTGPNGNIQWPDGVIGHYKGDISLYKGDEITISEIEYVVIDSTFKEVRLKSTANMFAGFGFLRYIGGFNYINTESVTDMSKMFYGCHSLSYVDCGKVYGGEEGDESTGSYVNPEYYMYFDFSTFNTQNVTRMDSMFAYAFEMQKFLTCYCHGAYPSLDLGSFDTRNVTNMSGMFAHCVGRVIGFDNFDTRNVTDMSGMFHDYYNDDDSWDWYMDPDDPQSHSEASNRPDLNSEYISQYKMLPYTLDLRSFDTRNVKNMSEMFKECSGVTEIIVGEGWTTESVKKDGGSKQMFEECLFLKGALGTTYDETHLDAAYAHPDEGVANPGYLTGVNQLDAVPLVKTEQTVDVWTSDGLLFIKVEVSSAYRIYDVYGRLVAQGTITEGEINLPLPRQSIYFVEVNGIGTKVMVD